MLSKHKIINWRNCQFMRSNEDWGNKSDQDVYRERKSTYERFFHS